MGLILDPLARPPPGVTAESFVIRSPALGDAQLDRLTARRIPGRVSKHLPGLFIGVGIIGTFRGLIQGLQAFKLLDDAGGLYGSRHRGACEHHRHLAVLRDANLHQWVPNRRQAEYRASASMPPLDHSPPANAGSRSRQLCSKYAHRSEKAQPGRQPRGTGRVARELEAEHRGEQGPRQSRRLCVCRCQMLDDGRVNCDALICARYWRNSLADAGLGRGAFRNDDVAAFIPARQFSPPTGAS